MTKRDDLKEYAELDGGELGEAAEILLSLQGLDYCFTEEFTEAFDKEIDAMLQYFRENTTIIERKETLTRTYAELEWKE